MQRAQSETDASAHGLWWVSSQPCHVLCTAAALMSELPCSSAEQPGPCNHAAWACDLQAARATVSTQDVLYATTLLLHQDPCAQTGSRSTDR